MSVGLLSTKGQIITFYKDQYQLSYDTENNTILLSTQDGEEFFHFPAEFKLSTDSGDIYLEDIEYSAEKSTLIIQKKITGEKIEAIRLYFQCYSDYILIGYEVDVAERNELTINSAVYFQKYNKGLYMIDCLKAFSPTPIQEGFYGRYKPQCSTFSTFCPPPLTFCIGNHHGLVSFGLIDLPDSMVFGMTDQLGILAEEPGGNKVIQGNSTYHAPRLLVTFPKDEWDSLSIFRNKLIELGFHTPKLRENKVIPEWWKKPIVCTYGDQIMELQYNPSETDDWDNPRFNSEWFEKWLKDSENRLGLTDFTIIIDAFWQKRFSADPTPDSNRFPDLRSIIDKCHEKGHHVLLWYAPFIDKQDLDFEPSSRRYGVISETPAGFDNTYMIDFTHPNIKNYLSNLAHRFFGSEDGDLNADGLKMDFLCFIRDPKKSSYSSPSIGMGIKEQYYFYKQFSFEAGRVKNDVLLNGSVCDPRFEDIISMNRLHDIHYLWWERELRARISSEAAPGIIIDSDGAIMKSDWIEQSYIDAVIYGTPSLYYIRKFHDGISLSSEKMKSLGQLLSLSSLKSNGRPVFKSIGNWQLINHQKVMGETIDGQTIILFDEQCHGYIFTWREEPQRIPLHGRSVVKITPQVDSYLVENNMISGNWKAGIVYHLDIAEEKG